MKNGTCTVLVVSSATCGASLRATTSIEEAVREADVVDVHRPVHRSEANFFN